MTRPAYIFCGNNKGEAGLFFLGEMYNVQFSRESSVVHNYIPVVDWDGNAKMFDKATDTYPVHYGNFTAGPRKE